MDDTTTESGRTGSTAPVCQSRSWHSGDMRVVLCALCDSVADVGFTYRKAQAMKASKHNRARRAMTLVEILIAIGILAVGMMCICSLLPLGIRNTAVSVDRTVAASVAKTAMESMKHASFDLTAVQASNPDSCGRVANAPLGLNRSLVRAIAEYWAYGANGSAFPDGRMLGIFGTGASSPGGFMVPADVELLLQFRGGATTNPAEFVRFPDNPEYGWTATLIPTVIEDNDHDGRSGEDKWGPGTPPTRVDGDGDSNADDAPEFTDTTSYYAQIAIWRVTGNSLDIKVFAYSTTVKILNSSNGVAVLAGDDGDQFLKAAKPGDYMARGFHRIWYQITNVDAENRKIGLAKKFYTPYLLANEEATGAGPVLLASRYKLVAIYNTVITP